MLRVTAAHGCGNQTFHTHTKKFRTSIAKHPFGSLIENGNTSFLVNFQDSVRYGVKELAIAALKAAFRLRCTWRVGVSICHVLLGRN